MLIYRREIDGLRAVAVLSVIFFHAGLKSFKGGYVGVDIFFVISGYLITSILLAEFEQSKFSILNFYERRARRIMPALFFVMAICVPLSWLIFLPKDLESFFKSLVAIPMFRSNIFFWKDVDYFATASEIKPLLHTWSLAVEEQYYILFPIFLFTFWRIGKRFILGMLILIATLSLIRAQVISSSKVSENFFLLPTRFWEISIGALITFIPLNKLQLKRKWRESVCAIGIFFILYSIFIFKKDTPFPSFYALIPTIGTALVIMFATQNTILGKILGHKFLVGIGLVSYSAYLWHQPIFAFTRYFVDPDYLTPNLMFVLSLSSIILAWLTWKYIESPFKDKAKFTRSFIFKLSALISLLFIFSGAFFSKIFGNYELEPIIASKLANQKVAFFSGIRDERIFVKNRLTFEHDVPDVLIIGSSRIMQIRNFGIKRYLGLGVSGASVEDDVAILNIVNKKFSPPITIISADPWLFNSNSGQGRWTSLKAEYLEATGSKDKANENTIVINGLTKLIRNFYEHTTYSFGNPVNDKPEFKAKIRKDGSHVYDISYISKTQDEIEKGFNDLLGYAMGDYAFSEKAKKEFEDLIRAQSNKSKVVLVLSPYHPKLYERMQKERPIFLQIENNFRQIAKENNIAIIGSYNPATVGCKIEDFYDGMHPKDECMKKILENHKL